MDHRDEPVTACRDRTPASERRHGVDGNPSLGDVDNYAGPDGRTLIGTAKRLQNRVECALGASVNVTPRPVAEQH